MTVELESGPGQSKVRCTGVVVACQPALEHGYTVSMVLSGLTPQSQALLDTLAQPRLD